MTVRWGGLRTWWTGRFSLDNGHPLRCRPVWQRVKRKRRKRKRIKASHTCHRRHARPRKVVLLPLRPHHARPCADLKNHRRSPCLCSIIGNVRRPRSGRHRRGRRRRRHRHEALSLQHRSTSSGDEMKYMLLQRVWMWGTKPQKSGCSPRISASSPAFNRRYAHPAWTPLRRTLRQWKLGSRTSGDVTSAHRLIVSSLMKSTRWCLAHQCPREPLRRGW
jgi:hypothetical protein